MERGAPLHNEGMEAVTARPLLRGWSHLAAIPPAAVGAAALVRIAWHDPGRALSLSVYGTALILLFTVSALYHLGPWSPRVRAAFRRADHATIFLMIAATYTPIVAITTDGWIRTLVLCDVWLLALVGAVLVSTPLVLPRFVLVLLYLCVGWTALWAMPVMVTRIGVSGFLALATGGALYSAGALVYAIRRPRLWPTVFGYHEVFHLMVIAATAVFYVFIAGNVALAEG